MAKRDKEDLPKFVVKIQYQGKSLAAERKKKGDDAALQKCTRYLYIYAHEDLDERMSAAWREDATAEVFEGSYAKTHSVQAKGTKGVWE